MIIAENVHKSYARTVVVDGVSLRIPARGITSIIGPNGAGKSTLLSIISRLMDKDRGTVTVDGLDVSAAPSDVLARRLSILRQENHVSSRLTVRDLVSFGRYPHSKGRLNAEDRDRIDRAIGFLHLPDLSERFLDELSGGQRQRAYIAMVLCQDTDYMLLDEPLNNLDMRHARGMMQLLRRAADDLGKTVVLVMHDINFASWYSDSIVAMKAGRIVHHAPVAEVVTPVRLSEIYDMEITVHEVDGKKVCLYYA